MKSYTNKTYLINKLRIVNYKEIAKENSVDPSTIQRYMRKFCLTKDYRNWTEQDLYLLKQNYSKNLNVYKLFPNRSIASINHKASRLGLRKVIFKKRYFVDDTFFTKWSNDMAYILGFFFSDGSVLSKKYVCSIHLNSKDHYILEIIRRKMNSSYPIYEYSNSSYFRVNSKFLYVDLVNLGCIPNKTRKLRYPNTFPNKYLRHFVRGFFDGDGSITFNKPNTIKISFVGTRHFMFGLRDAISKALNIKASPVTVVRKKSSLLWRFNYYGDDARKICYWMYKDCGDLFLRRKRNRFDNHIKVRNNDL